MTIHASLFYNAFYFFHVLGALLVRYCKDTFMVRRKKVLKDGYSSFTGCSYRGELARLSGLAHLGEMIFIPRSHGIFYLSSIKKFGLCIKPGIQERGTECGKRGEWRECYLPGIAGKQSGKCPQKILRMSSNIPGNIAKHSGECCQTFRGMSPNIPGNVLFTLMVENWSELHP